MNFLTGFASNLSMTTNQKTNLSLTTILGLILTLCLFSAFIINADEAKQLPANEVENYLMGKFNPTKHPAFIKVPKRYANRSGYYLRKEAYDAFVKMYDAARKDGVKLIIRSATRNFDYQKRIWERKWRAQKKSRRAVDKARNILKLSSMPGSSRHHWGTEIDLNAFRNDWFDRDQGLKLFRWMNNNAAKYGFQRPYTKKDSKRPTGYNEERWHWSYTPLSIPMLRDASSVLKDQNIRGFLGSKTAIEIEVLKNYIMGVSQSCR
jgi:LAS superfamily LD-carboxypeptidase LdcB